MRPLRRISANGITIFGPLAAAKKELLLGPKEERESQTARLLALISIAVLVLGWGAHYGLTAYLRIHHPEVVQQQTQVFSMGFSVFSGAGVGHDAAVLRRTSPGTFSRAAEFVQHALP